MHCSFVFGDLWLWNAYIGHLYPNISDSTRFWTLSLQLEHQGSEFSDCDQNFLIVIQEKMQIIIFWLWSDLSDCYPKKIPIRIFWVSDCDKNFLIVITFFLLWSEVSDCDRKFPIVIRIFWLWSDFSDCDQNFLIVIRIVWLLSKMQNQNFLITIRNFWLWSEFSDWDQTEKKTTAFWEINKTERPKTTNKDLKQFFASTDPPVT